MIQPTVITTAGSLTVTFDGVAAVTIRAVPFNRVKSRYYFEWRDPRASVHRVKVDEREKVR